MSHARIAITMTLLFAALSPATPSPTEAALQFASPHGAPTAPEPETPDRLRAWFADYPATVDIAGGRVFAETRTQVEDAVWALERFASVGLELPAIEFWMHADRIDCDPRKEVPPLAFTLFRDGQAVVYSCSTRFALLHELGHVFGATHLSDADKTAFAAIRDADGWRAEEWARSASEHFADVIAWGLHPDHVRPSRTTPNDDASLTAAFALATGVAPPP
jgi:hypothetical protein